MQMMPDLGLHAHVFGHRNELNVGLCTAVAGALHILLQCLLPKRDARIQRKVLLWKVQRLVAAGGCSVGCVGGCQRVKNCNDA